MPALDVQPMGAAFGGIVDGVDLKSLSDEDFEMVTGALWQYQVLIFRGQTLTVDEHIQFGKRFGALHIHPAVTSLEGYPEILPIKNSGKERTITENWHSDVCCEERPPSISILHAVEVPMHGGDTMWANQYAALDRLSPGMREIISPLRAKHTGFGFEAVHPVVRTHPETGRQALYVNHGFTESFEGMTIDESRPLLDYLIEVGSRPDLTIRHHWQQGDVALWDNRCVMHYAIHDHGYEPREMHRVSVLGERPR